MTQIATTREQAQRLLDCGVKAETADMCCYDRTGILYSNSFDSLPTPAKEEYFPAWSLSRLFDLLPKKLTAGIRVHELNMGVEPYDGLFYIRYINTRSDTDDLDSYTDAPDPIEACVQMIEWLVKHDYKLNSIEKCPNYEFDADKVKESLKEQGQKKNEL